MDEFRDMTSKLMTDRLGCAPYARNATRRLLEGAQAAAHGLLAGDQLPQDDAVAEHIHLSVTRLSSQL